MHVLSEIKMRLRWDGIFLDAVFLKPEERVHAERIAHDLKCSFEGLWLEASDSKILERRIEIRQRDASDATVAVFRKQLERGTGDVGWLRIDASESLKSARQQSLKILGKISAACWPKVTLDNLPRKVG